MQINVSVLALILFLAPMFYLLLAFPAFLLVRLDIPQVSYIFRSVLFGYFLVLVAVGLFAASLSALSGHLTASLYFGAFAAFDLFWRRWTMRQVDGLLDELQAEAEGIGSRLRRLHVSGMAINAAHLALVLPFIPSLVTAA